MLVSLGKETIHLSIDLKVEVLLVVLVPLTCCTSRVSPGDVLSKLAITQLEFLFPHFMVHITNWFSC